LLIMVKVGQSSNLRARHGQRCSIDRFSVRTQQTSLSPLGADQDHLVKKSDGWFDGHCVAG